MCIFKLFISISSLFSFMLCFQQFHFFLFNFELLPLYLVSFRKNYFLEDEEFKIFQDFSLFVTMHLQQILIHVWFVLPICWWCVFFVYTVDGCCNLGLEAFSDGIAFSAFRSPISVIGQYPGFHLYCPDLIVCPLECGPHDLTDFGNLAGLPQILQVGSECIVKIFHHMLLLVQIY